MKHIIKGAEPTSLKEYRETTDKASYNGFGNKADIRLQLIIEQRAICAYCMKRISMDRDVALSKPKTEIEHYLSQDTHGDHDLDYQNMLGVCNGNQKSRSDKSAQEHLLHCDKSKDSDENKPLLPLTVNPLDIRTVRLIKFKRDGEIYSDNRTIDKDLKTILNLNEQTLKKNRGIAIDFAYNQIRTKHPKNHKGLWRLDVVDAVLKEWSAEYPVTYGETEYFKYKEYCEAVIYHLTRLKNKIKAQK